MYVFGIEEYNNCDAKSIAWNIKYKNGYGSYLDWADYVYAAENDPRLLATVLYGERREQHYDLNRYTELNIKICTSFTFLTLNLDLQVIENAYFDILKASVDNPMLNPKLTTKFTRHIEFW